MSDEEKVQEERERRDQKKRMREAMGAAAGALAAAGLEALFDYLDKRGERAEQGPFVNANGPGGFGRRAKESPYSILGVAPDAPMEVIEAAYKALSKKWHPDREPDPNKKKARTEMMQKINGAMDAIRAERGTSRGTA